MNHTQVTCLNAIGVEVWLPIGALPAPPVQSTCYYCFVSQADASEPELMSLLDKILAALKWPREQVRVAVSFEGEEAYAGAKVVLSFGTSVQGYAGKPDRVLLLPTLSELNASPALKKHVWSQLKPFIF